MIERKDIADDDALATPGILTKDFQGLLAVVREIKAEVSKQALLAETATSLNTVGDSIEALTAQEKELIKVQTQLSTALAKDNKEYADVKKQIDLVNQSTKVRIALGERDATTLNKMNSSMKELGAALQKNRQAFAQLTDEQARNSKEGQKLLAVIQRQDAEMKDLNATIGKKSLSSLADQMNKGNVAAQALAPGLAGVATAIAQGTKAAIAFIATPLGLTLAAIGLALSPIITYFTSSAEGLDRVDVATARWNARLSVLKDKLAEAGKEMFGEGGEGDGFFAKLLKSSNDPLLMGFFNWTEKAADSAGELAKVLDDVGEAEAKWGAEVQELENDQARLILQSKNRTLTEQERIDKIDEAFKLEQSISDKRIEFADKELEAQVKAAADRLKIENTIDNSLVGAERVAKYRAFAKTLIDEGRKKDDAVSESLIGALKKQTEAEGASIVVQEKLQNRRDALSDKQIENYEKQRAAKAKIDAEIVKLEQELREADAEYRLKELNEEKAANDKKKKFNQDLIDEVGVMNDKRKAREKKDSDDRIKQAQLEYEKLKILLQSQLTAYENYSGAILDITGNLTAGRTAAIDVEISKLEAQTEKEIELAGDNEERKKVIYEQAEAKRAQLEAKRRQELRRQATLEKAAALIDAFIRTRMAVLLQLMAPPAATAIPRSIAAGVLGGLQIAAIAAKPLPQFEKGTLNSPAGPAIVGEGGRELKVSPSGNVSLTPSVPTIQDLEAGTKIFPADHKATVQALALAGLGSETLIQRRQKESIDLSKELKKIERNTRKIGGSGGDFVKRGSMLFESLKQSDGSRRLIRKSNLGY